MTLAIRESNAITRRDADDLLVWLEEVRIVLDGSGPRRKKFKAVMDLVKNYGGRREVMDAFLKATKKWLWDDRNWSQRLAILGGSTAVLVVGSLTAGLATAGMGVAVPVAVVVAAGGSLVGNMIDIIEQSRKEAEEKET